MSWSSTVTYERIYVSMSDESIYPVSVASLVNVETRTYLVRNASSYPDIRLKVESRLFFAVGRRTKTMIERDEQYELAVLKDICEARSGVLAESARTVQPIVRSQLCELWVFVDQIDAPDVWLRFLPRADALLQTQSVIRGSVSAACDDPGFQQEE